MPAKEFLMENKAIVPTNGGTKGRIDTFTLVGMGLLTAIVVVLQALAVGIRFGMFNITFVLVPIVVGAALYGKFAGMWLGLVFGIVVLFTDAGAFLMVNVPGTIITVLLKGMLAGFVAAIVYRLLAKKNDLLATLCAAVAAPVVNTGIFLLGCAVFFLDTISGWGASAGYENVGAYMIFGLVGINFLVEMAINLVLSSAIVRIVKIGKSKLKTA